MVTVCTPTYREEDYVCTVMVPKVEQRKIKCVTYRCEREMVTVKVPVSVAVCVTVGVSVDVAVSVAVAGETDPAAIAALGSRRLHATPEQLCDALGAAGVGRDQPETADDHYLA
jgi:hypothetical protein